MDSNQQIAANLRKMAEVIHPTERNPTMTPEELVKECDDFLASPPNTIDRHALCRVVTMVRHLAALPQPASTLKTTSAHDLGSGFDQGGNEATSHQKVDSDPID